MNLLTLVTVLTVALGALGGVFQLLLRFYWKDGRTRKHRILRNWTVGLCIVSAVFTVAVLVFDKRNAEQKNQSLLVALEEAKREREVRADAGQLESLNTTNKISVLAIGNSGTSFGIHGVGSILSMGLSPASWHRMRDENSIELQKIEGKLRVTAKIRTPEGLIAEIVNNEWKVKPEKIWDKNYTSSALEVKDAQGKVVFQVNLAEDIAHFQGVFHDSEGNRLAFMSLGTGSGSVFFVLPSSNHFELPPIKPMFKYPSYVHLGELAD